MAIRHAARGATYHRGVRGRREKNRIARGDAATQELVVLWVVVFLIAVSAAYALDIAPRGATELIGHVAAPLAAVLNQNDGAPDAGNGPWGNPTDAAHAPILEGPKIIINRIGVDAPIVFPANDDLELLNAALETGVVHYPGSSLPGTRGNVFLFGHSTGLPAVRNQAFAVFNRLKELVAGDTIRIQYGGREYWYRVGSIAIRNAEEALVTLDTGSGRLLTLSTCRIFGGRDERYVVDAEFVKSYPVRNPPSASDTSL